MTRFISTPNRAKLRRIVLLALALVFAIYARSLAANSSVTPQIGGGIGSGFDGGIGSTAVVSAPVTPCSQTGLIFTSGCNAILYVVLY